LGRETILGTAQVPDAQQQPPQQQPSPSQGVQLPEQHKQLHDRHQDAGGAGAPKTTVAAGQDTAAPPAPSP